MEWQWGAMVNEREGGGVGWSVVDRMGCELAMGWSWGDDRLRWMARDVMNVEGEGFVALSRRGKIDDKGTGDT